MAERLPAERPSDVSPKKDSSRPETGERPAEGPPPRDAPKRTLGDPGAQRGLPAPVRQRFSGGERVELTRAQLYADRRVEAGACGVALNPSSQAASWVVFFPDGGPRVVPHWDLEALSPPGAH